MIYFTDDEVSKVGHPTWLVSKRSPDAAERNPGNIQKINAPGFHFIPSGLRLLFLTKNVKSGHVIHDPFTRIPRLQFLVILRLRVDQLGRRQF